MPARVWRRRFPSSPPRLTIQPRRGPPRRRTPWGKEALLMSPSQPALRLEVLDGGLGQLTFDLPGSRANTLGRAVIAEFAALLPKLAARTDLRGLIFRSGKPGTFIVGADLRELGSAQATPDVKQAMTKQGLDVIAAFEKLPYPTVAAVEGPCAGGGTEIVLGMDFRICSTHPKTEIGLPEVKIGLIPGWGGTQRLARVIGPALAIELICAGELVKAERARQLGIVFDAVPPERLMDEAKRLLQWAIESGAWKEARQKKQQPVGVSEEQLGFIAAVARAQVLDKTKGHYPAPPAALDAIVKGCNLPLEEGLKAET